MSIHLTFARLSYQHHQMPDDHAYLKEWKFISDSTSYYIICWYYICKQNNKQTNAKTGGLNRVATGLRRAKQMNIHDIDLS